MWPRLDHARPLNGFGIDEPRAADVEDGRFTVFGKGGWKHILPPEAPTRKLPQDYVALLPTADQAMTPRVLRSAPPQFQGVLSAILRGLDKNVYLFSDTQCYDRSLERQYPTGGAWGRVRNRIAEEERVDAALMGRDGKMYLFRGDQFISYTPTVGAPTTIPGFCGCDSGLDCRSMGRSYEHTPRLRAEGRVVSVGCSRGRWLVPLRPLLWDRL